MTHDAVYEQYVQAEMAAFDSLPSAVRFEIANSPISYGSVDMLEYLQRLKTQFPFLRDNELGALLARTIRSDIQKKVGASYIAETS